MRTEETVQLITHDLGDACLFHIGRLPDDLVWDDTTFESAWGMHPDEYHEIMIHGRLVKTPRWQQAYGADYHYTGRVNRALPVPPLLEPLFAWARQALDRRLNGLLLNWYDGDLGHYIGAHRDSTENMVKRAPIVTVSFGEERIFRLRPWKGKGYQNFPATHGSVFVMPWATNLNFTHEIPKLARHPGQRISVTLRAFTTGVVEASA